MDKRYISFPQAGSSNRPELYANLKQNLFAKGGLVERNVYNHQKYL
jgi:hypothetical protein